VQSRLWKKWSPQQISNRLARDFPDAPDMRVSTETIYQAIYVHARGELKRELGKQLRRGRIARKTRKQADARRPRFVDVMLPIADRPAEIETRQIPGHWEGDLIIGAAAGSAIATLVERSSRYVMLAHLRRERGADAVRDSLINTVRQLPAALRGTLTWTRAPRCPNTAPSPSLPTCRSTSASPVLPGSAARTRTPTACYASTCPANRPVPAHRRRVASHRRRTQQPTPQGA
jgi:hypothetical protein